MNKSVVCHVCRGRLNRVETQRMGKQITSDCRPWKGEGKLAYCLACGLVQKPVSVGWLREIRRIYATYAVYEQGGGADQLSFNAATGGTMARSERIISWLSSKGQIFESGSLLDIGCGNGAFLQAFGVVRPGWQMVGLELDNRNQGRVESIPGVIRLHVGPVATLNQQFDLIVMVHALEHIPAPVTFLQEVAGYLNPGGRLLIQVPNLLTSPFDLLIADHCTHFSPTTLEHVVETAGYKVHQIDLMCVAKEITLLAEPVTGGALAKVSNGIWSEDLQAAREHADWMYRVLLQGRQTDNYVGVFGASISGTWLAAALGAKIDFFVDEDPNRIGRTQLGKPIYSPAQAPKDVDILMPMKQEVAKAIAQRLGSCGLRLVMPPAIYSAQQSAS
jgi:2-polyprenyl-3-methyl-5-hydroxy-6-metoxy-1,4-benzoquinol methylase